jgi:hypothetical protein
MKVIDEFEREVNLTMFASYTKKDLPEIARVGQVVRLTKVTKDLWNGDMQL